MTKCREAFTRVDLLVSLIVIGALAAMQLPAVDASRAAAQRNACTKNLREIAIAMQNYHAVYRKFPTLAGQADHLPSLQSASTAEESATQFSWQVMILPFLEQGALYNEISITSDRFRRPAFDRQIVASGEHPAFKAIPRFVCAAFEGKPTALAKEFQPLLQAGDQGDDRGIAISNYVALAATHLELMEQKPSAANGVLVPKKATQIASIVDGLAKTIVVAETKEQHYASWYDATCTWVVGLPSEIQPPKKDEAGRQRAAPRSPSPLSYGPTKAEPNRVYLAGDRWRNSEPRRWGPAATIPAGL